VVEYAKHSELPLHPDDVKQIEEDSKTFDNIEARIAAYPDVDFEIVISAIDFVTYAALTNKETICEYSGLPSVTSYEASAPATESVPAPDELQQELRRVRASKLAHVRDQRYTLAAIYREAEKELQSLIRNQQAVEYPEIEGTEQLCKDMIERSRMTLYDGLTTGFANREITDEEIEEGARKYTFDEYQKVIHYETYDTYNDFVNGAKWYREQLKQTQ
jgi:hypothetical protein